MTSCPRMAAMRLRIAILAAAALLALTPATASETISYTYDAHGRLVKVAHSGSVNDGTTACYTYDKADNRSNVTVATSSDCTTGGGGGGTAPSFAVGDDSSTEGTNMVFTVTRSGSSTGSYSMSYATANGTAVAGSDYTAKSGTVTFSDGIMSTNIAVATTDDTTVESSEDFYLDISNASGGATITDSRGMGTILDNDSTTTCSGVSFAVSNASVTEGGNLSFTVTKSGTTSDSCSVSYATANNTAVAGSDYTAKSGTLTFSSTQTSLTVLVSTIDDTTVENAETMYLNLSGASGSATISDSQGVGTINDNDSASAPSFSINDASATEGGTIFFTVTKSGSTTSSYSVNYATADSTALASSDYNAVSGTLTFGATDTSKTVTVTTINDPLIEGTEQFFVYLSATTGGATISDSQGIGTIYDDDDGCTTLPGQEPSCLMTEPTDESSATTEPATTEEPIDGTATEPPPPSEGDAA